MAESKFYLAIDIGASSGRHILGWLENGKIRLEELYRFENKLVKKNGHLCWDLEHLFQEVGYRAEVVLPATHDTGSAVMAVPTSSDSAIYLSSGTWSLMGIERLIPDCTERSRAYNFTNEGGCQDRFLNALIATETGKRVFAGPIEATAVGNLMAQMLKDGVFADLDEARKVVAKSFAVKEVEGKLVF